MPPLDRRRFLQASAIGLTAALGACIRSPSTAPWTQQQQGGAGQFLHGIASGDPLSDAVILWTRLTPNNDKDAILWVGWELALDANFEHIVRRGEALIDAKSDYTLKVDAVQLQHNTEYFFRFTSGDNRSTTGRTKTLSKGITDKVRLAVVSCANYPAGFFNVYRDIADIEGLDAIIHLGDYIYEYGEGGYATEEAKTLGRDFDNDNTGELLTLDDYRRRYAQYRRDQDLQAMHASAPCIAIWDDHEIANDAWQFGAENHQANEGSYTERREAAVQAYFEWMPIRSSNKEEQYIYRAFSFGDLVNLIMLDTRVVGRDKQLEYQQYFNADGSFDHQRFYSDVTAATRSLLGKEQRQWLHQTLAASHCQWQVIGQQLLIGDMRMPAELMLKLGADAETLMASFSELMQIKQRISKDDPSLTSTERQRLHNRLPYNLDAWDGYIAERESLYAVIREHQQQLIVLSGDTHNAWENALFDQDGNAMGTELATASVSSPGLEKLLRLPPAQWPAVEAGFTQLIEHLRYSNIGDRGYLLATFEREQCTAEWIYVDTVAHRDYQQRPKRFRKRLISRQHHAITPRNS